MKILRIAPPFALAAIAGSALATDNWPSFAGTVEATHYAAQSQITPANVASLKPVCEYELGLVTSFQAGPLVVDGTLYVTTIFDTFAIDAATCALKWRVTETYEPGGSIRVNRGPAYADGRLFRGTEDGRVLAYDAATGKRLWEVTIANPKIGETVPAALITWNGLVFAGNAGGDNKGVKGRIYAINASTGKVVWEQFLVPRQAGDASYGPQAPAPSMPADGWGNGPDVPISGGATWTSYSLDPATGTLYVPGGNPAPDFAAHLRPGTNPFSGTVVALDAKTGAVQRTFPMVERDFHDWDASSAPSILSTKGGRRLLASAIKDGKLRGYDLSTGALLYTQPVTTIENADTPLARGKTVRFCPGTQGGTEWNGPAYSPKTNLLYTGSVDWCATVTLSSDADLMKTHLGQPWAGNADPDAAYGRLDPRSKWGGWIHANDADTGKPAWRFHAPAPILAGVTATAGGLVFAGDVAGNLYAFDGVSGKQLWQTIPGGPLGGGIISYAVGGQQRLAVAAGMASPLWGSPDVKAKIVVYGLPR